MQRVSFVLAAAVTAFIAAPAIAQNATSPSPTSIAEDLLRADRDFSQKSASTTAIVGIPAMFADDVIIPAPQGKFVEGKPAAIEAMKLNPANSIGSASWTPVRAGLSADGQHGFTFGYMTLRVPDSADVPMKYLAYWVKKPEGWRVAVYKRAPRAKGDVSLDMMAPALPARIVAVSQNAAATKAFGESLSNAERAFSDEAQTIGLSAAFAKHGSSDAVNMGGPVSPSFIVSAQGIAKSMPDAGSPEPSSVSWGADKVIVASSGDFGVSIGVIRGNKAEADGSRAAFSFFTIWRRPSTNVPWLYVAE